nr:MAG TPA: hypothetical protein [Caudoviricetes sp.]
MMYNKQKKSLGAIRGFFSGRIKRRMALSYI